MNIGDFYHTYCRNCGTQRCEGPKSEWFDGCEYRFELDEYAATHERVPTLHELLEEINARTAQPSVKPDQVTLKMDFPMPKNCRECPFFKVIYESDKHEDSCYECYGDKVYREFWYWPADTKRPDWCPLVYVPDQTIGKAGTA